MSVVRSAKVFRNGGSQAIRLPKEFKVSGDQVLVRKDFDMLTIFPKRRAKGVLLDIALAIGPIELAPREQPKSADRRTAKTLRTARPRRA